MERNLKEIKLLRTPENIRTGLEIFKNNKDIIIIFVDESGEPIEFIDSSSNYNKWDDFEFEVDRITRK